MTPRGAQAPLGVRGEAAAGQVTTSGERGEAAAVGVGAAPRLPFAAAPGLLVAVIALALVVYAAIAADVVEGGWLSSLDDDLSRWVAG